MVNVFERKFDRDPKLREDFQVLLLQDVQHAKMNFDSVLPFYYLSLSTIHWTPVEVVLFVAEFLRDLPLNSKILDIGSGCGKFCLILSYLLPNKIYGIEQRMDLFQVAEKMRIANNVRNVEYLNMNMMDIQDWNQYDVFYLFNPFQEHINDFKLMRIDDSLVFDKLYYLQYTTEVIRRLSCLKKGTKLITFHGFGGVLPNSWKLQISKSFDGGDLSLWEKIE